VEVEDASDGGVGIVVAEALIAGHSVLMQAPGVPPAPDGGRARGKVAWCTRVGGERYRVGVVLDYSAAHGHGPVSDGEDLYEIMEVNATASLDTIHKIYRILALRLHPDNTESGSEDAFKRLAHAYKILSDPERRAAYDNERNRRANKTWSIFDAASALPGLEQEQQKRRAILAALYTKRMRQPEQAALPLPNLERLLGVPREHLEFPLWFLKEQGWITRSDNARFVITAKGVEFAESTGAWQPPLAGAGRLLASG
jgi:hypothetical protein